MISWLQSINRRWVILAGAVLSLTALSVLAIRTFPSIQRREADEAFLQQQREVMLPEFAGQIEALSNAPRYRLKARIDPNTAQIDGQLTVTFTNPGQEPLSELVFRLYPNAGSIYGGGSLTVQRISQGETLLQSERSEDGTLLSVSLTRPLLPGQPVSVDLVFSAQVPDFPGKGYGIFSRSDHVLALAGWYPLLAPFDRGWQTPPIPRVGDALQADTSLYEVELEVPSGYEVVSAGTVIATERSTAADSTSESTAQPTVPPSPNLRLYPTTQSPFSNLQKWKIISGPVREFALAISQDFLKLETQLAGITLRSYTLPAEDPNTVPEKSLELLSGAFRAYLDRLGPYPYAEFDLVEAPITIGGYEFSSMVIVDDESRQRGGVSGYEYLLAHETAHQWWYSLVGTPTVAEPWLDEAHATYSAVIYLQHAGHPDDAQALLAGWREELDSIPAEDLSVGSSAQDFSDWGRYRQNVYTLGALFLDDLRGSMGEEKFFELLSRFQDTYRYRRATTLDYLRMAQEIAGADLALLYQEYFGERLPPLSVWACTSQPTHRCCGSAGRVSGCSDIQSAELQHLRREDSYCIINTAGLLGDDCQVSTRRPFSMPGS